MSSRPSPMASVPVTSSEISSPTAPKFTTRLPSISSAVPSSPLRSVSFPCLYGPNSPSSCLHDISTSSDGAPVTVLRSIIIDAADLSQTDHDCASYHRSLRNSLFPPSPQSTTRYTLIKTVGRPCSTSSRSAQPLVSTV